MSSVNLGLTSSFPRSEALVSATRDLDRGRRGAEEVQALFDQETSRVIALEAKLGFSTVSGGDLQRQDLFRPFSDSTPGLEVGPLTRWFETNTFFRQPIVHAPPQWAPGAFARQLPLERLLETRLPPRVILPGPYTFVNLADNRTDLTPAELGRRWSELLALEVHDLAAHGVRAVQIQEPSLVVRPPSVDEEAWVRGIYDPLASALSEVDSLLWTFFGDGAPILPLLASLPVDTVGVDLADTDPALLTDLPTGKGLGLGCLDSRTTLLEDPQEIARIVREVNARLQPSEILLGPGAPLELVPWGVAERKLGVLPQVRDLLEGIPAGSRSTGEGAQASAGDGSGGSSTPSNRARGSARTSAGSSSSDRSRPRSAKGKSSRPKAKGGSR